MKKQWNGNQYKLGMLGGGQLGRMFIQEALNYDVHVHCIDPDPVAPCSLIASSFTVGSLNDYDAVIAFGSDKDVITVEIENVSIEALVELEKQGKKVFPQPRVLATIKDKGTQKAFYDQHQIPTAPFKLVQNKEELVANCPEFPFVLKLRTGGYDGKGVQIIRSEEDLQTAFDAPCVIEEMIPFSKELSVIVARNEAGQTAVYPTVECEFNPVANLVEFLFSPAEIPQDIEKKAEEIALQVIDQLQMVGILAVELFLTETGEILVNEIAPRPHNSGHHTIECCYTSQFEQHLRSVVNAPLGSTDLIVPGVMINLLGEENFEGDAKYEGIEEVMSWPGVAVHLYGKQKTKGFRKMGHVTIYGPDLENCKTVGRKVATTLKIKA
ncbi:MAG: 5-(carboxyamino)imidazole ribonucleotide synthase [Fluviicola sp.]|jgi:5-(carboxyamino)imidazole ribonucleotide synthase